LDNAIAVVGMAGRFPGADDVATFWRNICDGVESVSFFTEEELAAAGIEPDVYKHPDYVPARAVLADWNCFDAEFFDYSARDAEYMDPQQRLFLETAWAAMEDAGYAPSRIDGRVGVYAGASLSTYLLHAIGGNPDLLKSFYSMDDMSLLLGTSGDFLATRTAYKLGLTGPATTVQSACSTSLVAIHQACQSLLYDECDLAIAGGSSVTVPHGVGYLYREGGPKSQDGHCRAFDAKAGGAMGGSGVGAVVLKRLADAEHDHVYAVVRGSAVNNDGAVKVGFTAPSVSGQATVVLDAVEVSGVDPASIGLVEAHGTGTALGDPIEVAALTQAWRRHTDRTGYCALGSVKTNIGHLDAAAGVAGFVKAVSALAHKQLPPSLNFTTPNEQIDFDNSPFFVNTELRPWQSAGPRRAAVSAFGMGGTNAHAVLEEAPQVAASGDTGQWQVLPISARSATALATAVERLANSLETNDFLLADVAFTLQMGREEFAYRRAVVARDTAEAVVALRAPAPAPQAVAGRQPMPDGELAPDQLADLWCQGVEVDWAAVGSHGRRVSLPTYPFERRSYLLRTNTDHSRPDLPTKYVAPQDELERAVVEVWQNRLGYGRIGVDDDFYHLGGDSLLGTDVVADLREVVGFELPMERILEAVTPGRQAEVIRTLLVERLASMTDEEAEHLLNEGP
jgi:acyl transferase domain-containing protein